MGPITLETLCKQTNHLSLCTRGRAEPAQREAQITHSWHNVSVVKKKKESEMFPTITSAREAVSEGESSDMTAATRRSAQRGTARDGRGAGGGGERWGANTLRLPNREGAKWQIGGERDGR